MTYGQLVGSRLADYEYNVTGDSPGVKKLATAKGSRPIDTNSGSGPTDAANPQDSEWMKILEQLENKPSLGGSIRELRELLIQAIYAAKEEGWACAMQVNMCTMSIHKSSHDFLFHLMRTCTICQFSFSDDWSRAV